MLLPYTSEVFFLAMVRYHAAWWPVVALGALAAAALLVLLARRAPVTDRRRDRVVVLTLAAFAAWVGAVHQLHHMADLNFMAPVYGAAWLAHAVLLLLLAVLAPPHFGAAAASAQRAGRLLAFAGLVGYPLAVGLAGFGWAGAPLVGTAADPTALFTAGLALTARGWPRFALMVLPVAWAGVAALSGYLLRAPLDLAVAALILIALAVAVADARGARG